MKEQIILPLNIFFIFSCLSMHSCGCMHEIIEIAEELPLGEIAEDAGKVIIEDVIKDEIVNEAHKLA